MNSHPLTSEQIEHLLKIRVCGCDGNCVMSTGCPESALDGIGADWIANHFEHLAETLVCADRNARFVEKVRESIATATRVHESGKVPVSVWLAEFFAVIAEQEREIYNAPCKPVEPVKE